MNDKFDKLANKSETKSKKKKQLAKETKNKNFTRKKSFKTVISNIFIFDVNNKYYFIITSNFLIILSIILCLAFKTSFNFKLLYKA